MVVVLNSVLKKTGSSVNSINYFLSFFLYILSILCVTRNPPKIFIAAKVTAINPTILENEIFSLLLPNDAIIAPTIITEEIAFVTDIKGVCKEGVTLHTTK